ncbi:hypothetical protein ES703_113474 [subsurface metagenome]
MLGIVDGHAVQLYQVLPRIAAPDVVLGRERIGDGYAGRVLDESEDVLPEMGHLLEHLGADLEAGDVHVLLDDGSPVGGHLDGLTLEDGGRQGDGLQVQVVGV